MSGFSDDDVVAVDLHRRQYLMVGRPFSLITGTEFVRQIFADIENRKFFGHGTRLRLLGFGGIGRNDDRST